MQSQLHAVTNPRPVRRRGDPRPEQPPETIEEFLWRVFGGFQWCDGFFAPPKKAAFYLVKPLPTFSKARNHFGLDGLRCIPPGVYEVAAGFQHEGKFWLQLKSTDGQEIQLIVGDKQTSQSIDWREITPIETD